MSPAEPTGEPSDGVPHDAAVPTGGRIEGQTPEERDFGSGRGHADGHEYVFETGADRPARRPGGSRLTGTPHRLGREHVAKEGKPTRRTLPAHFHYLGMTDSAGRPWQGRHFTRDRAYAEDDGQAPEALLTAVEDFRVGLADASVVIEAIRASRLLIPLMAQLRRAGQNELGMAVDKANELAIVLVRAPDGRTVLPAFSSAAAMRSWDADARAMPAAGPRIALAAASEHADVLILDPGRPAEFAVRRPALWALAQGAPWLPPLRDPEVARAFHASVDGDSVVRDLALVDGDPEARLHGPEVIVRLRLTPGLTKEQLDAGVRALSERWAADEVIAQRVDSLAVRLDAA
ncbi:MAG TPA: SseB family protein [Microbacteriaceae bacterium]|nr:SseB family protein [Microbacteriaceae bacterium]